MKSLFTLLTILVSIFFFGAVLETVSFNISPAATITVTGEAKADQAPQIASFFASVTVFNEAKKTAVDEVNRQMETLVKAIKDFGIDPKDIQTQSVSVNEMNNEAEILIYPPRPDAGIKGWQASNSINVTLRDIAKASGLTNLLQASGATDISGPNFSLDDTTEIQADLLVKAVADAREKAAKAAAAGGRKLGKMMTLNEGYSYTPGPLYSLGEVKMDRAVADAPIEPGTERLLKTVTVVFALK